MLPPPPPPPPPTAESDSPSVRDLATRHLASSRPFLRFLSRSDKSRTKVAGRSPSNSTAPSSVPPLEHPEATNDSLSVHLSDTTVDTHLLPHNGDAYRWAVVYENQRGLTLFSMPLYSSLSLLPSDPPPFTIPEAQGRKHTQPDVTLTDYPLPDGTWHWVSSAWMIDMRDDGDVSYDGFEYNWFFRRHHWRPDVGMFGAGSCVRRRRWLRLMMRPADPLKPSNDSRLSHISSSSSASPTAPSLELSVADVWKGDSGDWERCRALMRRLNHDGKRLEVWREWLDVPLSEHAVPVQQWSEDDQPLPSEVAQAAYQTMLSTRMKDEQPPLERIRHVIRDHHEEIFGMFIFPKSRTELASLLSRILGSDWMGVDGNGVGLVDSSGDGGSG